MGPGRAGTDHASPAGLLGAPFILAAPQLPPPPKLNLVPPSPPSSSRLNYVLTPIQAANIPQQTQTRTHSGHAFGGRSKPSTPIVAVSVQRAPGGLHGQLTAHPCRPAPRPPPPPPGPAQHHDVQVRGYPPVLGAFWAEGGVKLACVPGLDKSSQVSSLCLHMAFPMRHSPSTPLRREWTARVGCVPVCKRRAPQPCNTSLAHIGTQPGSTPTQRPPPPLRPPPHPRRRGQSPPRHPRPAAAPQASAARRRVRRSREVVGV